MKILHLNSSLTGENSYSKKEADKYLKGKKYEYINLNKSDLGNITLTTENFHDDSRKEISSKIIDKLFEIDELVINAGLTNFNIPPTLVNFHNLIAVANKLFKFKYNGKGVSEGLLKHLKVTLFLAQGAEKGWYIFSHFDTYLKGIYNFFGAKEINVSIIYGTRVSK
ncbi:MAG: NAD(P)H-dependent oxidoreductase [Mollicutes bacterium PWAP]|nr:NAD(P)H-dependent oxidoreductase [Mollicutes bacterium PWAP]